MSPKEPLDLGNVRKVYFDTSGWNYLSKHADRAKLVGDIKESGMIVLASVISVGEVLRAGDRWRWLMCSTIRELHGDGHLLERPQDLAIAAAEAFRRRDKDMVLPRTGPGEALYSYIHNPTSPPREDISAWLQNMDGNLNRFIEEAKPVKSDKTTRYCSAEIFDQEHFLQALCALPFAKQLNFSTSEMRELCQTSDIWRALGLTLAYVIELSTTHAPKNVKRRRRPGGSDMWQLTYLGVAEVFVTGDGPMRTAANRVSSSMRYPRSVLSTEEFLNAVVPYTSV